MRLFHRKSRRQRFLEAARDALVVPIAMRLRRFGRPSEKTMKAGAIAAGGLTGLTAGSAGISALRRRIEEEDDS